MGGGWLKDSLLDLYQTLRDNPWVQGPQVETVKKILSELNTGEAYLQRGSNEALLELKRVENKHRSWLKSVVNLSEFTNFYFLNGVTEGLNQWRMTDDRPWQYLHGEYQWPQFVSGDGVATDLEELHPDRVLYLSNPSARDGNLLSTTEVDSIIAAGCPVILDCSYVGAVALKEIPIWEKVEQVFFGLSKGWGLVGQRIGVAYTRESHPTLKFMKRVECWNYLGVTILEKVIESFDVDQIYKQGKIRQEIICNQLQLLPSDTFFIANSNDEYFQPRRRGMPSARICLTPIWNMALEGNNFGNTI